VQELRPHRAVEARGPLLDEPKPEVDMTEQPTFFGLSKRRAPLELARPADVVEEGGCEQEVTAEPRVQLRRLATERRNADCVLEQAARVAVVPVRPRCGKRAVGSPNLGASEYRADDSGEARMGDLACEEVEEAVELVAVTPEPGRQLGRIRLRSRLDGAHLHLEPPTEPLHPAEDAYRVALGETSVQQLHVVPDARVNPAACIHELERQVGGAVLRPPPLLPPDGEHPFHGSVLGELGDTGHARSL